MISGATLLTGSGDEPLTLSDTKLIQRKGVLELQTRLSDN